MVDKNLVAIDQHGKNGQVRNVVVHQYEEVDAEIVIMILNRYLKDFEKFKDVILSYLKSL